MALVCEPFSFTAKKITLLIVQVYGSEALVQNVHALISHISTTAIFIVGACNAVLGFSPRMNKKLQHYQTGQPASPHPR